MNSVTQNDLARAFDITPASMSTMTVRLVAAGLILRKAQPNEARSNLLQLSAKGLSKLNDIRSIWFEMDHHIERLLGKDEADRLTNLTHELRDKLGGKIPHE
jgi:DNA-binding MarR family transcriptional regulator